MKPNWYQKKWVVVAMHSTAWVLLFSLPYLLRPTFSGNEPPHKEVKNETLSFFIMRLNDFFLVAFFYLNALLLFPKLLYRRKYIFYLLAIAACFFVITLQNYWLVKTFTQPGTGYTLQKHAFFIFFICLFILACSIAYRTIKDKISADNTAKEKENEFLKTELSLLRSQVSPHFMFNVLNNMVALARRQSDQLEPSLIKLSSLMRYMLYEADEEKVSLEKETEYLQSYIDLQQQRFGKKVTITPVFNEPDKIYYIEPMLLIPFVENAFKHGTGMIEQAMIKIELSAQNNVLHFTVTNKYNDNPHEIKDKASGIGLTNVARRLQLLYNNQHQLHIKKENGFFISSLTLQLTA